MAEVGESSGAKPREEFWAKLIPSDLRYPDVEISSCEIVVCSEILFSSIRKCKWCNITRNSDHSSATIQNKSSDAIVVDGTVIQAENTIVIRCGSEITSGPDKEGYLSYRFNILPVPESCQKKLKISMDAEHAICCICLNIWHDVVTVAPCFHNFCNRCFSEWLKRPLEKHSQGVSQSDSHRVCSRETFKPISEWSSLESLLQPVKTIDMNKLSLRSVLHSWEEHCRMLLQNGLQN